jgi:hypothetical protein
MKKLSLSLLAAACCMAALNPGKAHAQSQKLQQVATTGVGFSLVGILFSAVKDAVNNQPGANVELSNTPVIIGSYDLGLTRRFSIGPSFTYQSFTSKYTNYEYVNSNNDTIISTFTDRVTRTNVGIRPLFHFGGDDDDLDGYMGMRISFTQWNVTTDNPDKTWTGEDLYDFLGTNPVKFQVLMGIRYYFVDFMGAGMELGFGPSYYFMGGLNFRFGGIGGNSSSK